MPSNDGTPTNTTAELFVRISIRGKTCTSSVIGTSNSTSAPFTSLSAWSFFLAACPFLFQPLRLLPLLVSSRYVSLMIGACHIAHTPSNIIPCRANDVADVALLVCFSIDIKFQYYSPLSQCSVALFSPHHSYRTDPLSPFPTKIQPGEFGKYFCTSSGVLYNTLAVQIRPQVLKISIPAKNPLKIFSL